MIESLMEEDEGNKKN